MSDVGDSIYRGSNSSWLFSEEMLISWHVVLTAVLRVCDSANIIIEASK